MNDIGKYALGTILGILLLFNIFVLLCYAIDKIMWIYVSRSDKRKLLHNIITLTYGIVGFIGLCFLFPLQIAICLFTDINILVYNIIFPSLGIKQMKFSCVLERISNIKRK